MEHGTENSMLYVACFMLYATCFMRLYLFIEIEKPRLDFADAKFGRSEIERLTAAIVLTLLV